MDFNPELEDIADGVLVVPMPKHLNRADVIRETDEALRKLLGKSEVKPSEPKHGSSKRQSSFRIHVKDER